MYRLIKIVLATIALAIAFLFALNGRYTEIIDYVICDNWTGVYFNWATGETIDYDDRE
jgi:hypothetical protein